MKTDAPLGERSAMRRVGRFEIVRELARGGMAVVYLARQPGLDRDVAVKELSAFHAADPSFALRFLAESRIAGSLSHPNIVSVIDYVEEDGVPYIAMEYVEHGSLRPRMDSLTLAQTVGVLEAVLAALDHAHERGIVHRDLKPENLMVGAEGKVKVADFGIAKALHGGPTLHSLTATGLTVGTPAYMAPEQAMGLDVSARTDLYSVGVIAYELLAGKVPFADRDTPWAVLHSHIYDPPPPLLAARSTLDPRLAHWVERLLAKRPEDRHASAVDAWIALEDVVVAVLGPVWRRGARLEGNARLTPTSLDRTDSPDVQAAVAPIVMPEPAPEPSAEPEPEPEHPPVELPPTVVAPAPPQATRPLARPVRRRRWIGLAAALACAAAGVGALAWTTHGGDPPRPPAPLPRDVPWTARELAPLAVRGGSVWLTSSRGRVVRLRGSSSDVQAGLSDAARPRALLLAGRNLVVADDQAVTVLRADTLAPVAAFRGGAGAVLGGGLEGPPVAAWKVGPRRGRVCIVGESGLGPCASLPFAPSGVGTTGHGVVAVADRAGARVALLQAGARRLAVTESVSLPRGSKPHGEIVAVGPRLAVAARRAVVLIDLRSRRVERVVRLRTSPTTLSPASGGALVAPLYASDRVELIEAAGPRIVHHPIRTGVHPVAAAAVGSVLYVVTADDRRVSRFDRVTGEFLARTRVAALAGTPIEAVKVRLRDVREHDRTVVASIALAGGRLDASGLVARKLKISGGKASIELWQGGIRAGFRAVSRHGIALRARRAAGRVVLDFTAAAGAFERMEAHLTRNRRALVVVLVKTPPPPVHENPVPDDGSHVEPRPDPNPRPYVPPKPKPNKCEVDPISCLDFG